MLNRILSIYLPCISSKMDDLEAHLLVFFPPGSSSATGRCSLLPISMFSVGIPTCFHTTLTHSYIRYLHIGLLPAHMIKGELPCDYFIGQNPQFPQINAIVVLLPF